MSSNPILRQKQASTLARADQRDRRVFGATAREDRRTPTTCSTRSRPRATTTRRRTWKDPAPLLAVNSADDLINPPELGILEREIKRVPKGARW